MTGFAHDPCRSGRPANTARPAHPRLEQLACRPAGIRRGGAGRAADDAVPVEPPARLRRRLRARGVRARHHAALNWPLAWRRCMELRHQCTCTPPSRRTDSPVPPLAAQVLRWILRCQSSAVPRGVLAPAVVGDVALLSLPADLHRHRKAIGVLLLRKLRPPPRAVALRPPAVARRRADGVLPYELLAGRGGPRHAADSHLRAPAERRVAQSWRRRLRRAGSG
eukprot:SAG11_NODE_5960_length_1424_cov_3.063396_2_plen_223_part_00